MWWTYPFKVNLALAKMNIPPDVINDDYRSSAQQLGKQVGLTPEETAIMIVSQAFGVGYPDDVETAIMVWRADKKIDLSKELLREALQSMGISHGY